MSTNRAVWQDKAGFKASIRESRNDALLEPGQILLKPQARAINPCDNMVQDTALPFITYPLVLGEDVSGTVISVGSTASVRFKPHDRILAETSGVKNPASGAFQEYIVIEGEVTCRIPDTTTFAEASCFPLTITTPSLGLFSKEYLSLPTPSVEPICTGRSILVRGGSSAVGSNAIQLAKAAGLSVIATSSPKNFEYLKSLGASTVFDYSSPTIISNLVSHLNGTTCVGIFQAAGSVEGCLQISAQAKGNLFVAAATMIPEDKVPEGVRAKMVFGDLEKLRS